MATTLSRATRAIVLLALSSSACSRPDAAAHLTRAAAFADQGQQPEAIIEYRAAIQIDPSNGAARQKLGDAYLKVNDPSNAAREYIRAADLLATDASAQIRAGQMLLLGGRYEDARARADKALVLDPGNVNAQILKGNALAGLKDLNGAIAEYEDAISRDPARGELYSSLGAIQFVSGKKDEAEQAFLKAVERAPSVATHLALANFYWAANRSSDAEKALHAALGLEPTSLEANRALGVFLTASGRTAEAEPYFKTIAATSQSVEAQLTLAQFYVTARRFDEARSVLTSVAKLKDGFGRATVRLAALDALEGHSVEALQKVGTVLEQQPTDAPALILKVVLLVGEHKRTEALATVNGLIKLDPALAIAHFMAGQIYAQMDLKEDAQEQFEAALKLDRRPVEPAVELARLNLAQGRSDKALAYVQQAISLQPRSAVAHGILARIYVQQGEVEKAQGEVELILKTFPNASAGHNLNALVQLAAKRPQAALAAYEKALTLNPADVESLAGASVLDASAGRTREALARVDSALARNTPTPELLMVAARTHASAADPDGAERLLLRAIEADPDRLEAYGRLGSLYAQQRRLDEAIGRFREVVSRNPKSVSAETMIGILLEAQGKSTDAEQAYQKVLGIDSRAAVAANNLAYIFVSSDRNLDQALQLAQTAKEQLPDEPNVSDTLGWIYVKKKMVSVAIPHLETSAAKMPDDPVAHFHLGMAYFQAGEIDKAKKAFTHALALNREFAGAAEARKSLAAIG